jgi:hypothetical protein
VVFVHDVEDNLKVCSIPVKSFSQVWSDLNKTQRDFVKGAALLIAK